tara:strand:+ start:325 stop:672 length:348 start_codon:yes stop_codon:yes gene_type:complete
MAVPAVPAVIAGLVRGLKTKKGKEMAYKLLKKGGMINKKQADDLQKLLNKKYQKSNKSPKPSSPKNIATKNFAAGAVLGAGTGEAARITSKKIDELKRNKPKKTAAKKFKDRITK